MSDRCNRYIVRVNLDIELVEREGSEMAVANVVEEKRGGLDEAMREAVLASIAGSEYANWLAAHSRMSPEERETHIEDLRSLVVLYQGPGGP